MNYGKVWSPKRNSCHASSYQWRIKNASPDRKPFPARKNNSLEPVEADPDPLEPAMVFGLTPSLYVKAGSFIFGAYGHAAPLVRRRAPRPLLPARPASVPCPQECRCCSYPPT